MVTHDMREIAKLAATEAVAQTFMTLGLDIKDPITVQNHFAFLRNMYYAARHVRNVALGAVISAAVTGVGYAVWAAVKTGAAATGVK